MLAYPLPLQGLQPFTKRFGEPLHVFPQEPKKRVGHMHHQSAIESISSESDADNDDKAVTVKDSLHDFCYDSDDDESVSSTADDTCESNMKKFHSHNSDIIPSDAPIETVNTLKALKNHIRTTEKRSFTNLERQLLGTIVKHGILNGKKEETVEGKSQLGADIIVKQKTEVNHDSTLMISSHRQEGFTENSPKVMLPADGLDTPELSQINRKILLPTPGSFNEIPRNHLKNKNNHFNRNHKKPSLSLQQQLELSKCIKTLPFSKKVKCIQGSYHPDDEPTLEVFEFMGRKSNRGPGYEDLLNKFPNTKTIEVTRYNHESPKKGGLHGKHKHTASRKVKVQYKEVNKDDRNIVSQEKDFLNQADRKRVKTVSKAKEEKVGCLLNTIPNNPMSSYQSKSNEVSIAPCDVDSHNEKPVSYSIQYGDERLETCISSQEKKHQHPEDALETEEGEIVDT